MIDVDKLRKEASAQRKILQITFFPDTDSVTDALDDIDELAAVKFLPVSGTAHYKKS